MTDSKENRGTDFQEEEDDYMMSEEIHEDLADDETGDVEAQETETAENKKGSFLKELLVYIVIIVLCVTVVPRYVIQRTEVKGQSMRENLQDKENLLVEKITYHFKDPERFDIITFYPKGRDHKDYYIKRVIGLPGERIQISGNTIYINGEVLKENYGREPMVDAGIAEEEIKLGKDEFFVLGDNRNHSEDSRDIGVVKKENIDGHAVLRIYPFKAFGTLNQ